MKKFSSFVKEKKNRFDHFSWKNGDVATDESLVEWTADKPLKHETNYDHLKEPHHDQNRHEFAEHNKNLSKAHHEHMSYYKGDSYSTNHLLRHGKFAEDEASYRNKDHAHDHIKHMDHVTSYQTKHHHTTYRGGVPSDTHKFKPGHKFQDHGYSGTTFSHSIAAKFAQNGSYNPKTRHKGKRIIHVIHSPKGTKAHYIDHGQNMGSLSDEHEMVLHRGTKFKVTHHSEDSDHHYIHSRVVGQKHKKMPEGSPGANYSKTAHEAHQAASGITMSKHEDSPFEKAFKSPGHTIKMHITPDQQAGIDAHKKKQGKLRR